jgi:hypothetical protein
MGIKMNDLLTENTEILTADGYMLVSEMYDMLLTKPLIILPSYNIQTKTIELDICRKIEKIVTSSDQYYIYIKDTLLKLYEDHPIYIENGNEYQHIAPICNTNAKSLTTDDVLIGFNGGFNIDKIIKYTFKQPNHGYRLYTEKNNTFFATTNNLLL